MQEVEIPPRDLLQHYVAVSADQRGKTLVWWFSTRRKNISFGLYFKKGRLPAAPSSNVFISTGSSPTDSPQAPSTPQQQQQQRKPQPQPQHRRLCSHRDGQSHPTELSSSPVSGSVHAAAAAGGVTSAASRGRGASNSHNLASLLGTINNSLALAVKGPASPGGGRPQSPSGQNVPGFQLHNALPGSPASAGSSHSPPGLEPPAPGDAAKTSPGALRRGSRPTWSPKDSDMVCIRAIERFDSATSTIKGSHKIDEGDGMFVLVFDNTFSRNTSKRVTFFVAIKDGPPDDEGTAEIAGWLLKKKRKKMQGWATRWFQLDRGTLSYYKSPGAYCRGSVQIAFSAVSVHPSQRLIHIDSGSTIYHLKCLTQTEYQAWMSIIRKYYAVGAMDEDLLRSNRKSFGTTSRLQEGASADPRSTLDERKEPDRQNVPILRPDGSGFQEEALRAISFMKDRHENVVRAAARMLELESGSSMSTAISGSDPSSPKGARSRSPTTGSSGEQGKRRLLKKAASAGFKSANAIAAFSIANCHSEISFALSELKGAQDHVSDLFNEELNRRGALEATLRQLSESTSALASGPLDSVPSSLETSPSLPLVPGSYPSPPALFPPSKTSRSDLPHYFPVSGTVFASGNLPAYNVCEGSRWGESLLNVTGDDEFFDAREIVLEDDSLDEDDNNVGDAQREDEDDE
ncbi:MAG: Pleckstrin homology domain-containing protein, partial [Olpidium bornovanus]